MSLDANQILENQKNDKMDSPLDFLSINYNVYCNSIYSLSISQPTKYYEIRNKLLTKLNEELLEKTHHVIFNVLRYGVIGVGNDSNYTNDLRPNVPAEICNKISMDVAKAYQVEVQKIIKMLLPPDNESLAKSSLNSKLIAESIDRA